MENQLLEQTKYILKANGIKPGFVAGQNFLICADVLGAIIEAANIKKTDNILEIGPGLGVMTTELVSRAGKVLAVEYDRDLIPLIERIKDVNNNLELINDDILRVKNESIADVLTDKYRVVANIPYQITSKIIKKFLTFDPKPDSLILLVQKEVAERMVEGPGKLSKLAISVQFYGKVRIVTLVPNTCFWPQPKVDSAVIQITIDDKYLKLIKKKGINEKKFWSVVKGGFVGKRKTLANNLSNSLHMDRDKVIQTIESLNLSKNIRAQELSIEQWIELTKVINK